MIQLSPETIQQLMVAAEQALRGRHYGVAERTCRQVLAAVPGHGRAWQGVGLAMLMTGRYAEAAEALGRAAEALPEVANIWRELGRARLGCGRLREAAEAMERAVGLMPGNYEWCNDLGLAYEMSGQLEKSAAALERAVALAPGRAEALTNLGGVYKGLGRASEGVAAIERALAGSPDNARVRYNLANALSAMGRCDEAAGQYEKALEKEPGQETIRSGALLNLLYLPGRERGEFLREARKWEEHCVRGQRMVHAQPGAGAAGKRLRVGYVSADFRAHSVAYFLEPLLAQHDRREVEVFCYAEPMAEDGVTARFKKLADVWRPTLGVPHERVARQVREDGIDILVDLMGHTAGNRLQVFAVKAAPVQVTYLGYPETTGLSAMDYRLTDAWADPAGEEAYYAEKLVRLGRTFLCYQPPTAEEMPEVEVRGSGEPVTFVSFNAWQKVSAGASVNALGVIPLWARILERVPGSRLMLKAFGLEDAAMKEMVRERFAEFGVGPERLVLLGQTNSLAEHLACYGKGDVVLDTAPYHGTTTTCEALWMGVPVVTLAGDRHASRVGVSILESAGLGDLIAASGEEYVEKAEALARDVGRRGALRAGMRERMRGSALMDGAGLAREVERAYREMWRARCGDRHGS